MTKFFLLLLAVATAAACDVSTTGANGQVSFSPTDCGLAVCNLEDAIGVGGVIHMQIQGVDGVSTAGATLKSANPSQLVVSPVGDVNGRPTWELQALAPGVARLTVLTSDEEELDFVEVPIQDIKGFVALNNFGEAVGPGEQSGYDEVWTVNDNTNVRFQITPYVGAKVPIMGKYHFTVETDSTIAAGLVDGNLSEGYMHFNVPVGAYVATFFDDFSHTYTLLINAQ